MQNILDYEKYLIGCSIPPFYGGVRILDLNIIYLIDEVDQAVGYLFHT